MLEELKASFANINEWLRFAESKHAVLVGFNGAIVLSLLSQVCQLRSIPILFYWATGASVLFSISIIISLVSFLPRLQITEDANAKRQGSPNPLYFGDLAQSDTDTVLHQYSSLLNKKPSKKNSLEYHYVQQMVANSKIAASKYRMFTAAVWLDFFAVAAPIAIAWLIVLKLSRRSKNDRRKPTARAIS